MDRSRCSSIGTGCGRDARRPKRTEIEPADIKTLLADTFILEKDTRGEAVFRLAGTRLCASYGRELKGFAFRLAVAGEGPAHGRAAVAQRVRHEIRGGHLAIDGISRNGRSNEFEMVLLPLDGGVESPRCLGAATRASGRSGWAPIRSSKRGSNRCASSIRTASRYS